MRTAANVYFAESFDATCSLLSMLPLDRRRRLVLAIGSGRGGAARFPRRLSDRNQCFARSALRSGPFSTFRSASTWSRRAAGKRFLLFGASCRLDRLATCAQFPLSPGGQGPRLLHQ